MTYSYYILKIKNQSLNEAQESKYDILYENLKFKNLTQCLKSDLAGEGLQNMQPLTMVAQLKESLYLKNN